MNRSAPATESGSVTSGIVSDLIAIVGTENVLHRRDEMLVYECDGYMVEKRVPDVVVFPTSTEHVVEVVKLCNRTRFRSFRVGRARAWPAARSRSAAA